MGIDSKGRWGAVIIYGSFDVQAGLVGEADGFAKLVVHRSTDTGVDPEKA
jgi:hypothetical protein